jgi:glutathione S-transferase
VKRLRFYHRDACHLCEDMLAQLEELRQTSDFELFMIDIDEQAAAGDPYRHRIPVLEDAEGHLLCEVYLDPVAVLNYLRDP